MVALSAVWWVAVLWQLTRRPLQFDDAFMFYRYGLNLRHGNGLSWNPTGPPTFGETSLLWGFLVTLLTFLPGAPGLKLQIASWTCSGLALASMSWAVAANAASPYFRSIVRVLPFVVLPLLGTRIFVQHVTNGMETMLSMALVAAYAGMVLSWVNGHLRSAWCGAAGILLVLARPEAGLVILVLPLMASLLLAKSKLPELLAMYAVIGVGLGLYGTSAFWYFGTPVPLAFYVKSSGVYQGYVGHWHPFTSLAAFVSGCGVYLVAIAIWARRRSVRLLVIFAAPLVTVSAYLLTVLQIMGMGARYYLPYLPLAVIPSLLVIDACMAAQSSRTTLREWRGLQRFALVAVTLYLVEQNFPTSFAQRLDRAFERRSILYAEPHRQTRAERQLPLLSWDEAILRMGDDFLRCLPAGVSVAATEVGYIGAIAPQVILIDLSGLNDLDIATHGFEAAKLLARRPDIIWLPNTDYTYERASLLSNPSFLAEYTLYDGALLYGIAIRKDSPYRAVTDAAWQRFWGGVYKDYEMEDYVVQRVSWSAGG